MFSSLDNMNEEGYVTSDVSLRYSVERKTCSVYSLLYMYLMYLTLDESGTSNASRSDKIKIASVTPAATSRRGAFR